MWNAMLWNQVHNTVWAPDATLYIVPKSIFPVDLQVLEKNRFIYLYG